MATKTASPKRSRPFKAGDKVVLILGSERVAAVVVEDRGFIGVGGRQLLRIRRTGVSEYLAEPYEVPAADVERAD
jgi:hypothetical protein